MVHCFGVCTVFCTFEEKAAQRGFTSPTSRLIVKWGTTSGLKCWQNVKLLPSLLPVLLPFCKQIRAEVLGDRVGRRCNLLNLMITTARLLQLFNRSHSQSYYILLPVTITYHLRVDTYSVHTHARARTRTHTHTTPHIHTNTYTHADIHAHTPRPHRERV